MRVCGRSRCCPSLRRWRGQCGEAARAIWRHFPAGQGRASRARVTEASLGGVSKREKNHLPLGRLCSTRRADPLPILLLHVLLKHPHVHLRRRRGRDRRGGLRRGNGVVLSWGWCGGGGGMAGGKVQAWGARGRRGGRRALSSKSAHADALTPIFVAIAEPQLPEPMSATFSGIVAGRDVRERRLWMQGVVGGNRFCGSGSPSLSTTAPSSGSPQVLSPPQHSAVLDCVYRPHRGRSSWKCVRRPLATAARRFLTPLLTSVILRRKERRLRGRAAFSV